MNSQLPLIETFDDDQLEAWLAESGISARVVAQCPLPGCPDCIPTVDLAPAA